MLFCKVLAWLTTSHGWTSSRVRCYFRRQLGFWCTYWSCKMGGPISTPYICERFFSWKHGTWYRSGHCALAHGPRKPSNAVRICQQCHSQEIRLRVIWLLLRLFYLAFIDEVKRLKLKRNEMASKELCRRSHAKQFSAVSNHQRQTPSARW